MMVESEVAAHTAVWPTMLHQRFIDTYCLGTNLPRGVCGESITSITLLVIDSRDRGPNLSLTSHRCERWHPWLACCLLMSASRAIFRGKEERSIPQFGRVRCKAGVWCGALISTVMAREI